MDPRIAPLLPPRPPDVFYADGAEYDGATTLATRYDTDERDLAALLPLPAHFVILRLETPRFPPDAVWAFLRACPHIRALDIVRCAWTKELAILQGLEAQIVEYRTQSPSAFEAACLLPNVRHVCLDTSVSHTAETLRCVETVEIRCGYRSLEREVCFQRIDRLEKLESLTIGRASLGKEFIAQLLAFVADDPRCRIHTFRLYGVQWETPPGQAYRTSMRIIMDALHRNASGSLRDVCVNFDQFIRDWGPDQVVRFCSPNWFAFSVGGCAMAEWHRLEGTRPRLVRYGSSGHSGWCVRRLWREMRLHSLQRAAALRLLQAKSYAALRADGDTPPGAEGWLRDASVLLGILARVAKS